MDGMGEDTHGVNTTLTLKHTTLPMHRQVESWDSWRLLLLTSTATFLLQVHQINNSNISYITLYNVYGKIGHAIILDSHKSL